MEKVIPAFQTIVPRSVSRTQAPGSASTQKRSFRADREATSNNSEKEQPQYKRAPLPAEKTAIKASTTTRVSSAMLPPVSREESFMDVNGERRNARGDLVEEDLLMRPNLNRKFEAPVDTDRQKAPRHKQQMVARALTPEEEAQRVKRERERKEARGNQVRQRGSDKKQSKSGF